MKLPNGGILCTVYKGDRESELYVYVAKRAGIEAIPGELARRMGNIREVMTFELKPGRKLARADTARVMASIETQGYYLQLPPDISAKVLDNGD